MFAKVTDFCKHLDYLLNVYYDTHRSVYMRTNIVLDDNLVNEAFKYAESIHTKKDLIETALKEFVRNHKIKNLKEIKGKISFDENYNYKQMRTGK